VRFLYEGEGGGRIVGEGGYGGEGREEGGRLGRGIWTPEQLKEYCGSSGDVYAQIVFVLAHTISSSCLPLTLSQADGGQ
jgi:hypothetical protein